jgi:hypothetical protein
MIVTSFFNVTRHPYVCEYIYEWGIIHACDILHACVTSSKDVTSSMNVTPSIDVTSLIRVASSSIYATSSMPVTSSKDVTSSIDVMSLSASDIIAGVPYLAKRPSPLPLTGLHLERTGQHDAETCACAEISAYFDAAPPEDFDAAPSAPAPIQLYKKS